MDFKLWNLAIYILFGSFPLRAHVSFFQISYHKLSCYYSGVCFFFLFHSCCLHARCILCGIHNLCIGSPILIVHTKWSLVYRSVNNSYWLSAALRPVVIIIKAIYLYIFLLLNWSSVLHFHIYIYFCEAIYLAV